MKDKTPLTKKQFFKLENSLSDCYPLPNFEENTPLPLFRLDDPHTELGQDYDSAKSYNDRFKVQTEVSDFNYPLWLATIAQHGSIRGFIRSQTTSDLWRFWEQLEKAHRQVHGLLYGLSQSPSDVVVGTYMSAAIYHAGVESLMLEVGKRLSKMGVDGVNS